jgi:hypothetical protein
MMRTGPSATQLLLVRTLQNSRDLLQMHYKRTMGA